MNTAQPIIIKDHNYPFYKIYNIKYLLFVTFEKVMVMLPNRINKNMFLCINQLQAVKGALAVN